MNPNSKKPGHLFFTPRTPWGTRAGQQSFRQHQRASEDSKTAEKKALDQMEEQAGRARSMAANNVPGSLKPTGSIPGSAPVDKAGVPRSLQGQISPDRGGEVTAPSRKPLPAPQIPRMTNKAFPPDAKQQPLPQRAPEAAPGSGVLSPEAQQMPKPDEADKTLEKPAPKKHFYDNPLQRKGWELIPSVNPHGGSLQLRKNF